MFSYIVRRILLMIPTLIGITVMVFLIARFAPGRPGQMELDGGGMDAEEARALAEWYEQRYGLDRNLFEQYIHWWRGMFFVSIQAQAWLEDDEEPDRRVEQVFTYRQTPPEYYMQFGNGAPGDQWAQLRDPEIDEQTYRQDDPAFIERITEARATAPAGLPADLRLPEILPGYETPAHVIVKGDYTEIESLSAVSDRRLKHATMSRQIDATVPLWSDLGEPLYRAPAGESGIEHDDDEQPLIVYRNGQWRTFVPDQPPSRWQPRAITDPRVQSVIGRQLAQRGIEAIDGYAVPHHAILLGRISDFPGDASALREPDLSQATTTATIAAPARIWLARDDGALLPVYEQSEPLPLLVVRGDDGQWDRLIGATRVEPVPFELYRQSDNRFLDRLDDEQLLELSPIEQGRRMPRHAIVTGQRVELLRAEPTARVLRRYQQDTDVFEMTLGESIAARTTVMDELKRRLPVTLMISLIAFPLIYLIAIPTGMLMAVRRGKAFDAGANIVMLALWSIPAVLMGTLLIGYLTRGGSGLELFPNNGLSSSGSETWPFFQWLLDRFWHLVLPVTCIVYAGFAYLAKQMRAAMLDNFTMDYVRTAKAKGVPYKDTIFRHVLRNSLLPLITIFATILPVLIAGSIIVEMIFTIEGMGLMAFRAVQNRDYDVVQALALIAGVLNLIGLLIADICYALADPRITYN